MKRSIIAAMGLLLTLTLIGRTSQTEDKTVPGELPAVEEVLNRYVEALGGREVLESLTSRTFVGKEVTDLTSSERPSYEALYFEAYARSTSEFSAASWSDHGVFRQGSDGRTGWVEDQCGVQEQPEQVRSKFAFLLNPQGPLQVDRYFPDLTIEGIEEVGDRFAYKLTPSHRDGAYFALYFDAVNGLLVRIGHYWDVEDYREVDGVLVPHRVSCSRKGGSTVYEFSEINHNEPLSDTLFTTPTR